MFLLLTLSVLSVAKANLFASNNSEPGLEHCPEQCECKDLKTSPFGINVSCSGVELKNLTAWKLPASTTILDLSNNMLEKLPPELFLNTSSITELYVW